MESFRDEMSRIEKITVNVNGTKLDVFETHNLSESGNLLVVSLVGARNIPAQNVLMALKDSGIIDEIEMWELDESKSESWGNISNFHNNPHTDLVFKKKY